ncbi:hypothetical protein NPIL_537301 [Nephila pilipes]|uniref:Uncharacterized protein n=1 Tax=Nephila pilipes TaxID=299642 RepID=A0A8X6PGI7_NEPPI|nr:hypothetical protein NPIL_537301 [Nephila pilipes]
MIVFIWKKCLSYSSGYDIELDANSFEPLVQILCPQKTHQREIDHDFICDFGLTCETENWIYTCPGILNIQELSLRVEFFLTINHVISQMGTCSSRL